jgi:hypothetical protein
VSKNAIAAASRALPHRQIIDRPCFMSSRLAGMVTKHCADRTSGSLAVVVVGLIVDSWAKHCSRYGACAQAVYFVQEGWVRERYEEHHHRG